MTTVALPIFERCSIRAVSLIRNVVLLVMLCSDFGILLAKSKLENAHDNIYSRDQRLRFLYTD